MKKFYYLLICLMLPMVFISCGDDDDDEDLQGGNIVGTWVCNWSEGSHKEEVTVTFKKDGEYSVAVKCNQDNGYTEKGTYVYNPPILFMRATWNSDGDEEYTEKVTVGIKGKKMTFLYDDGFTQTFTKK